MLDFASCEQLVSTARDGRSKPVQNNTRVEQRDEDTYALRLHATDIATFHRDGRITVNSGGYRTITTADRLDGWVFNSHRARYSDHGVWYVKAEPDPSDPEPPRGDRSVPKPFHALDPGPEPVKADEGCLAGTHGLHTESRKVFLRTEEERREGDVDLEYSGGYFIAYVERDVVVATHYYEHQHETYSYGNSRRGEIGCADETKHEQCPHCKLFEDQHRAWEQAMNGGGWGRNRTHGYKAMVEMLERYGSREAWQEAYIADFRAAREARKVHKQWVERNRVMFEDGMEITSEGYAKRPDKKAIAREQRKLKRIEKQKKRINKFVADAVSELVTNGLPMPSGGDCWYCALARARQESEQRGMSMGDAMPTLYPDGSTRIQPNHEHLESHIKERYYVPSMLVNALRETGYKDVGIYLHLGMDPENDVMGGPGRRVSEDTVTRDLRKYLYRRLIPGTYGDSHTARDQHWSTA